MGCFGSELTIGALTVEAVRLRCGVASIQSTVNLRSMVWGSVVTQLLLPLFEDWTFPSVVAVQHGPLDDPSVPEDAFTRFLGPSSHPRPQATSLPAHGQRHLGRRPPHHLVRNMPCAVISGLVAVCEANQVSIRHLTTEVHH